MLTSFHIFEVTAVVKIRSKNKIKEETKDSTDDSHYEDGLP